MLGDMDFRMAIYPETGSPYVSYPPGAAGSRAQHLHWVPCSLSQTSYLAGMAGVDAEPLQMLASAANAFFDPPLHLCSHRQVDGRITLSTVTLTQPSALVIARELRAEGC